METVAVSLSKDVKQRLESLAQATGRSLESCLELAVAEFVERWEIHLRDLRLMGEEEQRAVLAAVED